MVLISLNTSVFETHAQGARSSSPGGPGGPATATAGTVYCTGPHSCYIVANATAAAKSIGGGGGNSTTSYMSDSFI